MGSKRTINRCLIARPSPIPLGLKHLDNGESQLIPFSANPFLHESLRRDPSAILVGVLAVFAHRKHLHGSRLHFYSKGRDAE